MTTDVFEWKFNWIFEKFSIEWRITCQYAISVSVTRRRLIFTHRAVMICITSTDSAHVGQCKCVNLWRNRWTYQNLFDIIERFPFSLKRYECQIKINVEKSWKLVKFAKNCSYVLNFSTLHRWQLEQNEKRLQQNCRRKNEGTIIHFLSLWAHELNFYVWF